MTAKPTKAQTIYGALAREIAEGRLSAGVALDETVLAKTYGVSRTPIREAIRQLEMTGLVEARSHRGAVVAGMSEKQLDDLFAIMAELEGLCAKWSSLAMTGDDRRRLRAIHDEALSLVRDGDRDGYIENNNEFHNAIYDGTYNAYLMELVHAARRRAAPYRHAQFQSAGRLRKSHEEHARVLDAIEKRDADRAYAEMRAHIVVVRSAVEEIADQPELQSLA